MNRFKNVKLGVFRQYQNTKIDLRNIRNSKNLIKYYTVE